MPAGEPYQPWMKNPITAWPQDATITYAAISGQVTTVTPVFADQTKLLCEQVNRILDGEDVACEGPMAALKERIQKVLKPKGASPDCGPFLTTGSGIPLGDERCNCLRCIEWRGLLTAEDMKDPIITQAAMEFNRSVAIKSAERSYIERGFGIDPDGPHIVEAK